jgi:hypothetical protein
MAGYRVAALAVVGAALSFSSAAVAAPAYSEVVISDSADGKEMHTFKPTTAKVYIRTKLTGVDKPVKAKSEWIAVKAQGAPPNYKIDAAELNAGPLMNEVRFNYSKPTAGWPVGDYRVDLFLDGKKVTDVKFTVAK